ncbi:MAG: helix-turn-helix domain-containing protein [Chloroflexi bacterium]|nr:helix-turn-helix domain-containing protein [Chloroflexota bacterium]
MKIGSVAKLLEVPVPTLRRWTQEFGDFLSPEARAGEGTVREFSHQDVMVLRNARDFLRQGMTYGRARRALAKDVQAASGSGRPQGRPTIDSRDADEDREYATRFVQAIVNDALAPYVERLQRLENELVRLRDAATTLESAPRPRWPFRSDH